MDVPVGQLTGLSGRRERIWSLVGGFIVCLVGLASFLVPWLVQEIPLSQLVGVPYPPLFTQRAMIMLDYYFLGMIGLGVIILEAAVMALRASKYPRTDGTRLALLGTAL